jgi:hypothetical protein
MPTSRRGCCSIFCAPPDEAGHATAGAAAFGNRTEFGVLGLKPFAERTLLIDYAARQLRIE